MTSTTRNLLAGTWLAAVLLFSSCMSSFEEELELSDADLVGSVGGLKGQYFNGVRSFDEQPVLARIDPVVNFLFDRATPDPLVAPGVFSIVWTGTLTPPATGRYTFYVRSGDSFRSSTGANADGPGDEVRLTINGARIIDSGGGSGRSEVRGSLQLEGGVAYSLRLDYEKQQGSASVRLFWSNDYPAGDPNRVVKQVVASRFLAPPAALPSPWVDQEIGVSARRSAVVELTDTGAIEVHGVGDRIGESADRFLFISQPIDADGTLVARITHAAANMSGLMFRENFSSTSRFVFVGVQRRFGAVVPVMVDREEVGGFANVRSASARASPSASSPLWVKLERVGDTFEASLSSDGVSFTTFGIDNVEMNDRLFAGLATTSDPVSGPSVTFDVVEANRDFRFLVRDGIASDASANDYYGAIGAPAGFTLDQFIASRMGGPVVRVLFRNSWDLGFWREMNCTETLSRGFGGCWVRNWEDEDDVGEPSAEDLGTVAMDVSPEGFTRFYVFGPDGLLSPKAILDSEGPKSVPELCTNCHGGQRNQATNAPDVGAIFREFEPSLLELRRDLRSRGSTGRLIAEREFARLNRAIRSANAALRTEAEGGPAGIGRARSAVIAHLDAMYPASPGILTRSLRDTDKPVALNIRDSNPALMPSSWAADADLGLQSAKRSLWSNVINPYCMNCHRFSSVDFTAYSLFEFLGSTVSATPGSTRGVRPLLKHYLRGAKLDQPDGSRRTLPIMPHSEQMMRNLGLLVINDEDDVRGFVTGNRFGELEAIDKWIVNHQRVKGLPVNIQ